MELDPATKTKVDPNKETQVLGPYSFATAYNCRSKDPKVTNCIGYVRVSTKTQREEGGSLANQMSWIEQACKKNPSLHLWFICADDGIEGRLGKDRPGLDYVQKYAEEGNKIVVTYLDRLTRDEGEYNGLVSFCNERKLSLEVLMMGTVIGTKTVGPTAFDQLKPTQHRELELGSYVLTYGPRMDRAVNIFGYCREYSDYKGRSCLSLADQIKRIEGKCVEYNTRDIPVNLMSIYVDARLDDIDEEDRPALCELLTILPQVPAGLSGRDHSKRVMIVDHKCLDDSETSAISNILVSGKFADGGARLEDLSMNATWESSFRTKDTNFIGLLKNTMEDCERQILKANGLEAVAVMKTQLKEEKEENKDLRHQLKKWKEGNEELRRQLEKKEEEIEGLHRQLNEATIKLKKQEVGPQPLLSMSSHTITSGMS